MKNFIRDVKVQEGSLKKADYMSEGEQIQDIMKNEKESNLFKANVDEEFNLPYGFGFDYIIKEKGELINNKKTLNNQMMDELVEKLGYLDFRDALAANKYILEAKKHGDYHQQARARTLALAMDRMSRLKKEQIEKKLSKAADKEEQKLKLIMDEDPIMAKVYQEVYSDVKLQNEAESDALQDLHQRFDTYYDKDKMEDKLPTQWYDLQKID